ncbi:hypothetical protein HPG69_002800 [Diceros bicornis minor]|uniref:Histidine N-acetyltransferase C-terminal domain-containing protein n=1 Tax=Diceros bicornis minor TaxID=77932 RepID=A0A7J7EQW4_DICBM|nr:hypothetical protein HPG69_002800 [Diceros bicornis minor]
MSGLGLEAEAEPLGADTKAKSLGAKARSGSGPEAQAEPLDFVVATEQEFEEVLAISGDIYGGLNYLPSRYHGWLWDPDRTVVLTKQNGVIALESVHVIDARKSAPAEGLRVAPCERGKGHPGVKVARLTLDDQLGPRELKKYRLITKQGILLVRFNASALPAGLGARLAALQASGTFPPLPTEAVSEAGCDVARLLLSPSVQRDVLPGRTIIQDWQPYRRSESNLHLLVAKGLEWCVDSRARPLLLTLCTRPFPIPRGSDGTWHYLNIHAFGSDGAQVRASLWHLLRQAPRLAGFNVTCQLFLAPQLWSQLTDFCPASWGLELVKGYTEQYLLEADI